MNLSFYGLTLMMNVVLLFFMISPMEYRPGVLDVINDFRVC